ncbi:MAG: hypothetical protein ACJA1C_001717 [Crocinitomicaceae bacterium]|jgi:hypothetical protein
MIKTWILAFVILVLTFCTTKVDSQKKGDLDKIEEHSALICECFSKIDFENQNDSIKAITVECITDVIGENSSDELRTRVWESLYNNCDVMFNMMDSLRIHTNDIDTVKQILNKNNCSDFKNIRLTDLSSENTYLTIHDNQSIFEDENGIQKFSLDWKSPCKYTATPLDNQRINDPPSRVEFYNISGDTLTLRIGDSKRYAYLKLVK